MQTQLERVRQCRICVSLWACAYEFLNHSFVSDAKYDEVSKEVKEFLEVDTDRKDLDIWFRKNFDAHTGQWIYKHPDLKRIKNKISHLIWLRENPL